MFSLKSLPDCIFQSYANVVLKFPLLVILSTFTICLGTSAYGIFYYYHVLDFDPARGFETRGTEMASARLTLEALKGHQLSSEKTLKWFYMSQSRRKSRQIEQTTTLEPITVDYDEYGVDSEPNSEDLNDPCEMYAAFGKKISYEVVEYLAKIMIQLDSYEELFTERVMQQLCEVDRILEDTITETNFTNSAANLKHSMNIPLYTTCPNLRTANDCESINQDDIDDFRQLLDTCKEDPSTPVCEAASINQVINLLLPRDFPNNNPPIISVVLRVTMYNNFNREFYDTLVENLDDYFYSTGSMQLVGVAFNLKNQVFVELLKKEIILALVSAVLVFSTFLVYSSSIIFTLVVFSIVLFSAGCSFFVYTVILGIDFFPFLNLLVGVLLISIGADDAFLLTSYYKNEIERMDHLEYKAGTIYIPLFRRADLFSKCLRLSLKHSLMSMFVTSITTAIAFLSNLTSPVIVIRCFGTFACITVLINFILVMLVLPGTILLTSPKQKQTSLPIASREAIDNDEKSLLISFTYNFRYCIALLALILTLSSSVVLLKYPGITMPRYSPTKILRTSNIHEYFDEYLHLFNFEWQRSPRLVKNFIFGVESLNVTNFMSPYKKPTLGKMKSYKLDAGKMEILNIIMNKEGSKYHRTPKFWTSAALMSNETCFEDEKINTDCVLGFSVKNDKIIHEFPNDFAVIPSDGPLVNHDFEMVGYFISIPTDEKLRTDSFAIESVFKEMDATCSELRQSFDEPVMCLSSSEITRFYDIIFQLKSSSATSIGISLVICLIVIILSTRKLKTSILAIFVILSIILWTAAILVLLGWQLSAVESTILVITIGLSFDYTLHYAVAFNSEVEEDFRKKLRNIHKTAGKAAQLGALTLFLAGFPLIFAETSAFSQIGNMLLVLSVCSILGAQIVFPAFFVVFTWRKKKVYKL